MKQPYWKPQHEVFIRAMLKHEDPAKAYQAAYPNAKPASARVGGIRLSNYPHIKMRIQPILQQRREHAHAIALQQGLERERKEVQLRNEMRAILYKVIEGHIRKKRNFKVNGEVVTVEEDLPHGTILNAIVLDLRLQAGYNNWSKIIPRFNRIMLQTLPPELRQQTVTNSKLPALDKAGPIGNSLCHSQPGAVEKKSTIINAEEQTGVVHFRQQSVTNSHANPIKAVISNEAKQSVAKREISRTHAISNIAELQEISPASRNDAFQIQQQPSISELVTTNETSLIQEQTVTNSPSNPVAVRPAQKHKTIRITRPVTKNLLRTG